MTNDIQYTFTSSGTSPHRTSVPKPGTRHVTVPDTPDDIDNHWFLKTLLLSQLNPAFPVGTKLVLTVPNPDRSEDDYVRTWEIVS